MKQSRCHRPARPLARTSVAVRALLIQVLFATLLAGPATAETRRWVPVAGKSHVSFEATFPFGDFSGHTQDVGGEFRLDPSDLRQPVSGLLRVNSAALRTGVDGRDRDMWKALDVKRYPEIRFVLQGVEPSFPSVSDRADVLVTIRGGLLIRGVERSVTFASRARLRDARLWVRGQAMAKMSEFGITPPRRFFFAVGDAVTASFDVLLAPADRPVATRSRGPVAGRA